MPERQPALPRMALPGLLVATVVEAVSPGVEAGDPRQSAALPPASVGAGASVVVSPGRSWCGCAGRMKLGDRG